MKKLYIEILLKDIISELKKINAYKCIVAKSNFYGYGYKMLNYIYDYFDCIVVADEYEANTIKLLCPLIKKRFIVLYGQCVREKEEDMYDIVSLHLAVNTRDWTCTSKISAMLGTLQKNSPPSGEEFSTSYYFTFYSITVSD